VRTNTGEYRRKFLAELLQGDFFSYRAIALQLDSEIENAADLRVEDFTWQAESWDAIAQHASRFAQGFENRDRVSAPNS